MSSSLPRFPSLTDQPATSAADRRSSNTSTDTGAQSPSQPASRKRNTKETADPFPAKRQKAIAASSSRAATPSTNTRSKQPATDTGARSPSQPAGRKRKADETAIPPPAKKRSGNTAKKSTAASSSRAAQPESEHNANDSDVDSLFGDTVLESIEKPSKPAKVRRQKGSQLKKIIGQAKRETTAQRQARIKLQAEEAKRVAEEEEARIEAERRAELAKKAKAAREAREAEEARDLAARSLISPSLTPTIIASIGQVKLNPANPLSALLSSSDADMEAPKHGNYPIVLSDALLGQSSKETVTGIRCKFSLPSLSVAVGPSLTLIYRQPQTNPLVRHRPKPSKAQEVR